MITDPRRIKRFTTGIRFGQGRARAVFEPSTLLDFWIVLKICISEDCIVICQAANTGVTGGSTPDGDNYDRDVVIISTLKLDTCITLCDAQQALVFAGGTLFELENVLDPHNKNPHSVIGSSCIGASVIGDKEKLKKLQRLYWFTIEFGLMRSKNAFKIYGAGIISSKEESENAMAKSSTKKEYNVKQIMNHSFRTDVIQDTYYVINSFEELKNSIDEIRCELYDS